MLLKGARGVRSAERWERAADEDEGNAARGAREIAKKSPEIAGDPRASQGVDQVNECLGKR